MEIFSSELITNKEIDLNWHSQEVTTWVIHNEMRFVQGRAYFLN